MKKHIEIESKKDFEIRVNKLIRQSVKMNVVSLTVVPPKLPGVFKVDKSGKISLKELKLTDGSPNRGHTNSVLAGYEKRVQNYLSKLN